MYKYRYPNSIDKYRRFKLLYETLTQYYISKNNAQLAQNYFDSSKIFTDSILYIRTNMTSVKTEGIFNLQQSEIQKLKLTNDLFASQKKQYLIWGILIIVLLSGAFGFSQYHNKAKLKEALLQLEKEKVEVDLSAARAELENYILKFATLSQPDENEAGWKEITILTQEHWQKFQELFHNSYPDFTQRAYEKIPSLTETELRHQNIEKGSKYDCALVSDNQIPEFNLPRMSKFQPFLNATCFDFAQSITRLSILYFLQRVSIFGFPFHATVGRTPQHDASRHRWRIECVILLQPKSSAICNKYALSL